MDKKTYTYYFRLRPPSIGTHPNKGNISMTFDTIEKNGREYWGTATYNRPLTEDEKFNYDLD